MTESFPRQQARTRRFTLGVPRAFRVSPDGTRVVFLRTRSGSDPVTCLWVLDVATGTERLVVDPRTLGIDEHDLPAAERARRERVREQAGGVVAYTTDAAVTVAVFVLAGHVYAVDLAEGGTPAREVPTRTPAQDPRPDPAGRKLAYVCEGVLRVTGLAGGGEADQAVTAAEPDVTFGLAEFVAAEEMERHRGYWWAPDGSALLAARVDESPVPRWHISDPANPQAAPAVVRYPSAGSRNADVSLVIVRLGGGENPSAGQNPSAGEDLVPVQTDRAAFPYLVTASWVAGHPPLIVDQSRDQRTMRLLALDPATGRTEVLRTDTDPHWVEIVPGVPAWTSDGAIVWTQDSPDTRRLLVGTPEELRDRTAVPVTPPGLQVRSVLDVDGDTVLFQGGTEPTEAGLWTYGPGGVTEVTRHPGYYGGHRAGGTTVVSGKALDYDGTAVHVLTGDQVLPEGQARPGSSSASASIASLEERPALPVPSPVLIDLGARALRTAVLFPSWYQPGSGKLPVLVDPYGGPHAQRVLKARAAFHTSQWFADQGFAVVVADGAGTPGRGPAWEREIAGDLATSVLGDQVDALAAAAERFSDLDTSRVAIRGWSFGGYLAALAVLRRPDVFHAAVAGAPVTDWRLYDTHYTERYLGLPDDNEEAYRVSSLVPLPASVLPEPVPAEPSRPAPTAADPTMDDPALAGPTADTAKIRRPLLLIHGLADDNVVFAHSLRLSGALLAVGYPHTVLPLTGITHMAAQEVVAENMLLLQLDFLRNALASQGPAGAS